jgi:WD40 repeat protein/tRNA A-37 threonylcarbamoyl transferase component Bud32
MSASHQKLEAIFDAALELSGEEREIYLARACAGNPELRQRIERLLHASDRVGQFLTRDPGQEAHRREPKENTQTQSAPLEPVDLPTVAGSTVLEGPGTLIGRYKLLEKLGEGGFGAVYVAEQREPVKRRVALKIIKLGMDTRQVVARFEAERQALALMDHPHIAKVLDAGATDTGRPYFVMELVRGVPMTRYCDENSLPTAERLKLFIQVCQAIQHAHQKGIIHRDIKPSNILVTLHDGVPVPKVIDFGIAKATQGELTDVTIYTQFQQFVGTPAYMSPEQAEMSGLDIDTRSDIYSRGVLLYELLVGKTPFDAKELMQAGVDEMRRTIREREPVRPSTRLSGMAGEELTTTAKRRGADAVKLIHVLRGDLDWIVMKALEKDRTRRYETANGLAADVKRHLDNEAVVARPPSAVYRFQKLARRNKLAFGAATAVGLALVLGVAISTWQAARAVQARNEAKRNENVARQARGLAQAEAVRANKNAAESQANLLRAKQNEDLLKIQRAEDFFAADDSSSALVYLAQVLRQNPTNRLAAQRLISALTQRNFPLPILPPLAHQDKVLYAEFSPDGQYVVTASADHTARVWDSRTGQAVTPPLQHGDEVYTARFSPDGRRVVTGSRDTTARVWQVLDGQPVTPPLQHHYGVSSAEFSPDGRKLVTAADYDPVQIWDAQTGEHMAQPLLQGNGTGWAVFSPDGQRVLTASADQTARVWDSSTGQMLIQVSHDYFVETAEFSPDGNRIVTAAMDNTARVWDSHTGQPLTLPLRHETWVTHAAFSPDGQRIVTHSQDNVARMWDARTAQPLTHPFKYQAGLLSATSTKGRSWHPARFTPDGQGVLAANWDHTARLWNARTGQPLTEALRQDQEIFSAGLNPDGRRVVTASADSTARIWDTAPGQLRAEPLGHNGEVTSIQFSPDGQKLVTGSEDGTAWVWDVRTSLPAIGPLRHDDFVLAVQFSPDGQKLATASHDHTARVWDTRTGRPLTDWLWHQDAVRSLQFSSDGNRLLTASDDGVARVWDAASGKLLLDTLRHATNVVSARFSPDDRRIVTVSRDTTARLWDAHSGAALTAPLKHGAEVLSARFSPDGAWVATASADNQARIWNASTGQLLTPPLVHGDRVLDIEFSPDGNLVVTASADKTARIWDARSGHPFTDPLRHKEAVNTARFSPDGQWVGTASADYSARVWDTATGQPVTEPFRHEAGVNALEFSPDGTYLATASADHSARVWELPAVVLPVPEWLPRLAEDMAGKRYAGPGISEIIPANDLLSLKSEILGQAANDRYVSWAKWFFEDRLTRTIAPHSPITLSEYLQHRLEPPRNYSYAATGPSYVSGYVRDQTRINQRLALEEALRVAPRNHLALARLARAIAEVHPDTNSLEMGDADWFSRRALELAPDNLEVRWSRAVVLGQSGALADAFERVDQLIRFQPDNPDFWNTKASILESMGRLDEAYPAYSKSIELATAKGADNIRAKALMDRYHLLCRQNRSAEARADLLAAKGDRAVPVTVPERDPRVRPELIDLSPHLDMRLTDDMNWWPNAAKKHDYGLVPRGIHRLVGVDFDLRGSASIHQYQNFPGVLSDIVVNQKGKRIHFLHAEKDGRRPPIGTQIGQYVLHYADHEQIEFPIRFGVEIADTTLTEPEKDATFQVAWTGTSERIKQFYPTYKALRLFKATFENPRPDEEIKTIDVVATKCTLLLFAVTVDPY